MEDKLQAAVTKGAKAKHSLGEPIVQEAFLELDFAYVTAWRNARTPDERERCWMAVKVLEGVQNMLGTFVANGTIAQGDIERLSKQ